MNFQGLDTVKYFFQILYQDEKMEVLVEFYFQH